MLYSDQHRLQQVLRNLLSNAVKFTTAGQVTLSIRHAGDERFTNPPLTAAEHVVAFEVTDTGIGIAPEQLRTIFEAFQQADGTISRKFGGTGLGLSISREIARLIGGEIHVESDPGRGSTFTLYLPVRYDGGVRALLPAEVAATPRREADGEPERPQADRPDPRRPSPTTRRRSSPGTGCCSWRCPSPTSAGPRSTSAAATASRWSRRCSRTTRSWWPTSAARTRPSSAWTWSRTTARRCCTASSGTRRPG